MSGSQYCVAAYAVGLVLILGYAVHVWLGCVRARRRASTEKTPLEVVVTTRRPVSGRAS